MEKGWIAARAELLFLPEMRDALWARAAHYLGGCSSAVLSAEGAGGDTGAAEDAVGAILRVPFATRIRDAANGSTRRD